MFYPYDCYEVFIEKGRKMNKFPIGLCILTALVFLSCSSNDRPSGEQPPENDFQVILITDVGGLGDKGFNDAGWKGCKDAQKRLADRGNSIEIKTIESREQTDYNDNLNLAAERAEVIVALGFLIADSVQKAAPHYPDKAFVFIDGRIKGENIASFDFKSQEGAFQAGILGSYVTETDTIAVMPGMDIPPVEAFATGYRAGANTGAKIQEKEIKILSSTIGSFTDPVKAKSLAQSLMGQGADILFQLAGNSGIGVIEAVREAPDRRFAIGVDINQDDLAPGKILTSVLKRMDRVVSDQIVAAYDRQFVGGIYEVGLKDGYVGLTEMEFTRHLVPEKAFLTMDRSKELIISGTLTIPKTYEELENFKPPIDQLKTQ